MKKGVENGLTNKPVAPAPLPAGNAGVYFKLANLAPEWKALYERVSGLNDLASGWDSYSAPPPSEEVIQSVYDWLEVLRELDYAPSRLAPSVVGGVGITFKNDGRKAYIEFRNTGSVHVLFSDGAGDPRVEKVELGAKGYSELISKIKAYLR